MPLKALMGPQKCLQGLARNHRGSESLDLAGLRSIFFVLCKEATRVLMMRQGCFPPLHHQDNHTPKCSDRTVDLGGLQS